MEELDKLRVVVVAAGGGVVELPPLEQPGTNAIAANRTARTPNAG
jgi:hypothetical protein